MDTEAIGSILMQVYINTSRKGKRDFQCNLNTTKKYRLFLACDVTALLYGGNARRHSQRSSCRATVIFIWF